MINRGQITDPCNSQMLLEPITKGEDRVKRRNYGRESIEDKSSGKNR